MGMIRGGSRRATGVITRRASNAVTRSAAQPRSKRKRRENGARGRFVDWTFRRIREARSERGGFDRAERKREIVSSKSRAARRHSAQWAR